MLRIVLTPVLVVVLGITVPASAMTAFPVSNSQLPLSAGCQFVDTTVPGSVLGQQMVPVPVSVDLGSPLRIHGRLCLPAGDPPRTVLLALHGWTYTNQYWDVGYQPGTYSFADHMTGAGYAVYAIDRLGYGQSDHPLSAAVTVDMQAAAVHQVVQQLRTGAIGGAAFDRVALVGHSMGSAVALLESSEYNDADAVIATGFGSTTQLEPAARFASSVARQPAMLDPKTSGEVGLDPGYVTTPPGGRAVDYLYYLDNADPSLLNYDDNVLRDTAAFPELPTALKQLGGVSLGTLPNTGEELTLPLPGVTQRIQIPTFLLNGARDLIFCGPDLSHCRSSQALQQSESPHYSPAACFRAAVIDQSGHNVNLQRNAPVAYETIQSWIDQSLGPDGTKHRSTCR